MTSPRMPGHRLTRVALYGRKLYPAYVRSDARCDSLGRVRPFFTRRTAHRIVRDLLASWEEVAWEEEEAELPRARWHRDELIVENWLGVPGRRQRFAPRAHGLYPLFGRQEWVELLPPWPKRRPTPSTLLRLIGSPAPNYLPLIAQIRQRVPTDVLVTALTSGDRDARGLLIRILSDRTEASAIEAIVAHLDDPDAGVRVEVGWALENREDPVWGPRLMVAGQSETDERTREVLLRALGASGHAEALPWLRHLREDPSTDERTRAAASTAIEWIEDYPAQDAVRQ